MSIALVQTVPYINTRSRVADPSQLMRLLAMGAGGVATAAGMIAVASWTSAWMVTVALSGHPNGPFAQPKPGLRALALVESAPVLFAPVQMAKVIEVPAVERPLVAEKTAAPQPALAALRKVTVSSAAAERPMAVATLPLPAFPAEALTAKPMWPVKRLPPRRPFRCHSPGLGLRSRARLSRQSRRWPSWRLPCRSRWCCQSRYPCRRRREIPFCLRPAAMSRSMTSPDTRSICPMAAGSRRIWRRRADGFRATSA